MNLETIFKYILDTHGKRFLFYRIEQALAGIGIKVRIEAVKDLFEALDNEVLVCIEMDRAVSQNSIEVLQKCEKELGYKSKALEKLRKIGWE